MLDKAKVVEILRSGNPLYKVNIKYVNHGDISHNLIGHRVASMWVPSSKLGGMLHTWDCTSLIECLITDPDEDIYMWYDDSGRVEFMFGDSKYLDVLTIEQLEMCIDKSKGLWKDKWKFVEEAVSNGYVIYK